jgi:hypothetical protein
MSFFYKGCFGENTLLFKIKRIIHQRDLNQSDYSVNGNVSVIQMFFIYHAPPFGHPKGLEESCNPI